MKQLTEDQVREQAGKILGFSNTDNVQSGVGQITTFNQLGFKGNINKPDGRYLPENKNDTAIILETKSTNVELKESQIEELLKNCRIVATKYKNVIGILHNGIKTRTFKNEIEVSTPNELQNKEFYLKLFSENKIDKQQIYAITKRINDSLHFDFGIKNLYHRMIFTSCALVAARYGAFLSKGMDYPTFHTSILSGLSKSLQDHKGPNSKLNLLLEVYGEIKMNYTQNQVAIDDFIEWIQEISDLVNSDYWNGEDVMGIFFNEFNRYKKKSESGQVFTPDHITSFMYRLIDINKDDIVLDAACGSGAFLVKSMCNMVKEVGGINTNKAKEIKKNQLYGIEFDREIYALACANMLIHKDGKTNLEQMDSRKKDAGERIKSKHITKVLMNPPFENKYGCIDIVENVLDNVQRGAKCAFIMPDKKLEKVSKNKVENILMHNSLKKIIKLPEETFDAGVTTSIFIFEAGIPQNYDEDIFACYIENDGLERVKNQGRQDIKDRWQDIENERVEIIKKQSGNNTIQRINPKECLSYQMPKKEFKINEIDFEKNVMDYLMFEKGIDVKEFKENLINSVIYNSEIAKNGDVLSISIKGTKKTNKIDISQRKNFKIGDFFDIINNKSKLSNKDLSDTGETPVYSSSTDNNGIFGYTSKNPEYIINNKCPFFVIFGDHTKSMHIVNENFCIMDNVKVLKPHIYNFNITRFILTSWYASIPDLGYSRHWSIAKESEFLLPVDSEGNPDRNYMENYIKDIMEKNKEKLKCLI